MAPRLPSTLAVSRNAARSPAAVTASALDREPRLGEIIGGDLGVEAQPSPHVGRPCGHRSGRERAEGAADPVRPHVRPGVLLAVRRIEHEGKVDGTLKLLGDEGRQGAEIADPPVHPAIGELRRQIEIGRAVEPRPRGGQREVADVELLTVARVVGRQRDRSACLARIEPDAARRACRSARRHPR